MPVCVCDCSCAAASRSFEALPAAPACSNEPPNPAMPPIAAPIPRPILHSQLQCPHMVRAVCTQPQIQPMQRVMSLLMHHNSLHSSQLQPRDRAPNQLVARPPPPKPRMQIDCILMRANQPIVRMPMQKEYV